MVAIFPASSTKGDRPACFWSTTIPAVYFGVKNTPHSGQHDIVLVYYVHTTRTFAVYNIGGKQTSSRGVMNVESRSHCLLDNLHEMLPGEDVGGKRPKGSSQAAALLKKCNACAGNHASRIDEAVPLRDAFHRISRQPQPIPPQYAPPNDPSPSCP